MTEKEVKGEDREEKDFNPLEGFNDLEKDTLKEVGNISLGSSATIMSQLMSHRVNITTPSLSYVTIDEINEKFTAPCILVEVEYVEGLIGKNLLIIDTKDAVVIGQLMMMEEPDPSMELSEIHLSAVSEAMNQMMGASATAMSDMFQRMINISSPRVQHKKLDEAMEKEKILEGEGGLIQVAFRIEVAGLIDSELLQLMPLDFARQMVDFLIGQYDETEAEGGGPLTEKEVKGEDREEKGSNPLQGFNDLEKDTLKEVGNISLGSSATILSQLMSHRVNITTPSLSYVTIDEINGKFTAPCILVEVEYVEGLTGKNLLIIDTKDAVVIGQLMMMEEPDPSMELSEIHLSAVSEAMNQMMGASATAMSDMFQRMINISSPRVQYKKLDEAMEKEKILEGEGGFIQVAFRIEVAGLIDSELLQLMPLDFARQMVDFLIGQYDETEAEGGDKGPEETVAGGVEPSLSLAGLQPENGGKAHLGEEEWQKDYLGDDKLNLVNNISLEVKGIVGRVRLPLEKVLQLDRGSVVELDTHVGDEVELLVNGKRVAAAEIVAVDNHYGLKLTRIHEYEEKGW